ncbi:hypothetical protein O2W14_06270 [Modestobacter sp. VKM Ac-2986]|uniref:hypothetical protein n=1 Tax=Modestobacter sp. VKM Ac-2986 TaxID=3004140 RepID=UPI0022AA34B8|nr:hypothetical protein [Modestobacter sp. VKM Ac-2986]MCZ2828440.1 hypothetical protein [Modestobacter sp. VKM Ac-2986]
MNDEDLQRLIWRRLFELGLTAEEASARTLGVVSKEAVRGLMGGRTSVYVSDRIARALARALDVPEHRVRRTAGLPVEDPETARTGPHLRIVR